MTLDACKRHSARQITIACMNWCEKRGETRCLICRVSSEEASITATLYVYILMAVMDALIESKT